MNLLFTGASGFLGNNIFPLLKKHYNISTIGLTPRDTYMVDLVKGNLILNEQYGIVLHAAGKAHSIPKTNEERKAFFDVNLEGTKNLCTALERSGIPKCFIFISTVAVYGCTYGENITENHPLNGRSPYALSKIKAEEYLKTWCQMHSVNLSILRPSLIAGPTPPGNLGAMINGIRKGKYLRIAGSKAKKSILMVQDIANLIPLLVDKGGTYNVCDSYQPSFYELESLISKQLGKPVPYSIPYWLAKCVAVVGDCFGNKFPINSLKLDKMPKSLTFSNEKAKRELNWKPLNVLENFKLD